MRLSFIGFTTNAESVATYFGGCMLQNIRDNATGWISKTIIGVIAALLALTGFEAIFQSVSNSNVAATVNGQEISRNELQQAMDMQRRQMQRDYGDNIDINSIDDKVIREAALEGLIGRALVADATRNAKFGFPLEMLNNTIRQTPEFQVNGQYNPGLYVQLVNQMGFTPDQYIGALSQDMQLNQLRAGIMGSTFITDAQLQHFAKIERQTRDFAYTTLAKPESVDVSDADVKAYYDANQDSFKSPEQAVIEYIQVSKDQLIDDQPVSDEQLRDQYAKEIAGLAEQRRAAHILIEVNDQVDEKAAKAKADDLEKRIAAGEDFSALAKANSDDLGSSLEGGDLGFAGTGVYDQAFEEALYALEKGQVSAPVRGEYGWHIIKLVDVRKPEVPSFESLKAKLKLDVVAQNVESKFIDLSKELSEKTFEANGDLQQPASELKLKVQVSEPFTRQGLETGVLSNKRVLQAVFSPEVLEDGNNSELIELDPSNVLVLRVKEHIESKHLELADVAADIKQQLVLQKATEQVKEQGEKLIAQFKQGEALEQKWVEEKAVARAQENLDPYIVQALFRMPKPEADKATYAGLSLANGDYVVMRLSAVNEDGAALSDEELAMYKQFFTSRAAQDAFNIYVEQLRADAKIEIVEE